MYRWEDARTEESAPGLREELKGLAKPPRPSTTSGEHSDALADLENGLASLLAPIHAARRELDLVNETLQATCESVATSAEELRCNHQELRSVKLTLDAVNAELQMKLGQLDEAAADLDHLSRASGEPRVYLDDQLRLVRVTPETSALFPFKSTDVGRRITDFNHQLDYPDLESDLHAVLKERMPCSREVGDSAGRRWQVTLQPMILSGPENPRVVMSCIDVSSQRQLLQLQRVVDAIFENIAGLDPQGLIQLVRDALNPKISKSIKATTHSGLGHHDLR